MRRLKDLVYEDKKENKTPKLKIEKVAKPDENLVKPSFEISYLTSFYYSPIKKFLFTPKFDPDYMNFSNCEHKNIEKRMVYVSFIPLIYNLIFYTNLEVLKLKNVEYFRFNVLKDTSIYRLELTNVKKIYGCENELSQLQIIYCDLEANDYKKIFTSNLKSIEIEDCKNFELTFLQNNDLKIFHSKNNKIELKSAVNFIKSKNLLNYRIEENNYAIEYNRIAKQKHFMKFTNFYNSDLIHKDLEVLEIRNCDLKNLFVGLLTNLKELKIEESFFYGKKLISDLKDKKIKRLELPKSNIPPISIGIIIKIFKKTLRHLDLSYVEVYPGFLEEIQKSLSNCTVIYSTNIIKKIKKKLL